MSENWLIKQWRRLHPLGKASAAIVGLGIALGGLAGYFHIFTTIHDRLSPKSAAETAHLSVLVLPFVTLSGGSAQDYVADAVTRDVTAALSRIRDSFVIGRGTAFSYKGKTIDLRSVAHQLGVRHVLLGTVAREGDKLRITTQLVDGASGATLSTQTFDSDLADQGELREKIASRLAVDLNVQRDAADGEKSRGRETADAVDLTLRGWAQVDQHVTKDNLLSAQRYFTAALGLAPDDESALAGRGQVLADLATHFPDTESTQRMLAARQDLTQALEIDPKDPIALTALSRVEAFEGRLQKALFDNQLAIDLAPSSPEALASQSALLILSGKSGQALKMINLALELSPFDPQLADFLTLKCKALIQFHEYSQAVTFCARSVALRPDWRNVSALVVSYMIIGDLDHVKQTKALLLRVKPDFTVQTCRETLDAMSENPEYRGFTERFAFYLKQAGLPE